MSKMMIRVKLCREVHMEQGQKEKGKLKSRVIYIVAKVVRYIIYHLV